MLHPRNCMRSCSPRNDWRHLIYMHTQFSVLGGVLSTPFYLFGCGFFAPFFAKKRSEILRRREIKKSKSLRRRGKIIRNNNRNKQKNKKRNSEKATNKNKKTSCSEGRKKRNSRKAPQKKTRRKTRKTAICIAEAKAKKQKKQKKNVIFPGVRGSKKTHKKKYIYIKKRDFSVRQGK